MPGRSLDITHYMDEVEALADHVAVLNNAQIVAIGTPGSLGGRDSSAVTIRFALPDGISASDLPVPYDAESDGLVEIQTEDELPVIHALSGWALDRNLRLRGLSIARVTLEDIYLKLTREEQ